MTMPNVIVQVVQHLRPGGIETMSLDLQRFGAAGDASYIVSLEGTLEEALAHWPRLEDCRDRIIFMTKKPGLQRRLIGELKQLFKKLGVTAVHTHHIGPLIYAGIAARLARIKHIVHTEHDAWHLDDNRRRRLQHWAMMFVRPTVVADSNAVAEGLRSRVGLQGVTVIRNGIDTKRFSPGDKNASRRNLGLPVEVKLVGCAGRLERVKGQATLVSALAQLGPNVHLAIAGDGSLREELQALATNRRVSERVHFLGRVDDMPTFYRALDVFCLPSEREGMPLAPMEAQACGVRTVVTDTGGATETICPYSGASVRPGDTKAMGLAIASVLKRKSGHSPRDFIEEQCNVRRMAAAYDQLLSDH